MPLGKAQGHSPEPEVCRSSLKAGWGFFLRTEDGQPEALEQQGSQVPELSVQPSASLGGTHFVSCELFCPVLHYRFRV